MTAQRLVLGESARVVAEDEEGIRLEGPLRLRPGRDVDVIRTAGRGAGMPPRRALVWSWRLIGVGSQGPVYRGDCRWTQMERVRDTPAI